jgi:hypothetical protein
MTCPMYQLGAELQKWTLYWFRPTLSHLCDKRIPNCNTKSSTTPLQTRTTKHFVRQLRTDHRKHSHLLRLQNTTVVDNMNVMSARGMRFGVSSTQLYELTIRKWVSAARKTPHSTTLNQCPPEGTTYRFNTILPGINTVCTFRSQIGNTTVWNRKRR